MANNEYFNIEKIEDKPDKIDISAWSIKDIFDLSDPELVKEWEELENKISKKIQDLNKNLESLSWDKKDQEINTVVINLTNKLEEFRNNDNATKEQLINDISTILWNDSLKWDNSIKWKLFSAIKKYSIWEQWIWAEKVVLAYNSNLDDSIRNIGK